MAQRSTTLSSDPAIQLQVLRSVEDLKVIDQLVEGKFLDLALARIDVNLKALSACRRQALLPIQAMVHGAQIGLQVPEDGFSARLLNIVLGCAMGWWAGQATQVESIDKIENLIQALIDKRSELTATAEAQAPKEDVA